MLAHTRRLVTAAAVLALAALVASAAPSHATGASITSPEAGSYVQARDPFRVTGTCPTGSRTATVVVTSDGDQVAETAVEVGSDLTVDTTLDISKAPKSIGRVTLGCFSYAGQAPLGTAEVEFFLIGSAPPNFYDVVVVVSPRTVPLGGTITVSTTCEPGTEQATVFLESGAMDDILFDFVFRQATAKPEANGAVRWQLPVTAETALGYSPPELGKAGAFVVCGDPDALDPTTVRNGFGQAFFTIAAPAASSVPTLAATGSGANGPLATLAIALLCVGAGAHRLGRYLRRRA